MEHSYITLAVPIVTLFYFLMCEAHHARLITMTSDLPSSLWVDQAHSPQPNSRTLGKPQGIQEGSPSEPPPVCSAQHTLRLCPEWEGVGRFKRRCPSALGHRRSWAEAMCYRSVSHLIQTFLVHHWSPPSDPNWGNSEESGSPLPPQPSPSSTPFYPCTAHFPEVSPRKRRGGLRSANELGYSQYIKQPLSFS